MFTYGIYFIILETKTNVTNFSERLPVYIVLRKTVQSDILVWSLQTHMKTYLILYFYSICMYVCVVCMYTFTKSTISLIDFFYSTSLHKVFTSDRGMRGQQEPSDHVEDINYWEDDLYIAKNMEEQISLWFSLSRVWLNSNALPRLQRMEQLHFYNEIPWGQS